MPQDRDPPRRSDAIPRHHAARAARTVDAADFDVARYVRPGDVIAWGQCGAEPCTLTEALVAQRHAVGGRFTVMLGTSWSDTLAPEQADTIDFIAYSGSGTNRRLAEAGVLDILPVHYSQFARALTSGPNRVDVLFLQVAPLDGGGYSLSIAHEYLVPLIRSARIVIAEVNAAAPCTHGAPVLTDADLDVLVRTNRVPLELARAPASDTEATIARHAASLIDDGATLQCGVGALPEAILGLLADRRDLGIHSGTIGDAVADLHERGIVTNAGKPGDDRGVTVAGTMMGSRRIYAFAHRNPAVQLRPTEYTHDIGVLGRLPRFTAINSAIEVDLTGQVNGEQAGSRYLGAVGGAIDFMRGAARSSGGLPMIVLPSRARDASRIVATLSGPVSIPRADAGVIVTEYGIADLRGLTLRQRVRKMLDIASPELRATLADDAARAGLRF